MAYTAGVVAKRGVGAVLNNKNTFSEYIPTKNSLAPAVNVDGKFETLGLNNVDIMRIPDGVKMVRELEKSGLSTEAAKSLAEGYIKSGSTPPVATPLDIIDKLVKIVPAGDKPSSATGYWMRKSELHKHDPATLADKFGLPPRQQVNNFDLFQIAPTQGAVVFESKVAATTVDGIKNTNGGAKQSIVVDRTKFTPPVKIGSIKVK
jgi:hypothetical protein